MSDLMRDQHAEAVMLGGPGACPFDCAACEWAMRKHVHHFECCDTEQVCHDEECLYGPGAVDLDGRHVSEECSDCQRGRLVGALVIPETLPLVGHVDVWDETRFTLYTAADLAALPF